MMRRPVVGPAFLAVMLLHIVFGLVGGWSSLTEAARDGWIDAFGSSDRQQVLWFLFTGFAGIPGALSIWALERNCLPIPRMVGLSLTAMALLGVTMVPASGFWLVLAVGIAALARSMPRLTFSAGHAERRRRVAAEGQSR